MLLLILAGWINRKQHEAVEYLLTENRILRNKLGKKRILLNDDQRRRLAIKGKILGRKMLEELAGIVTPDTILRRHREPGTGTTVGADSESEGRRCRKKLLSWSPGGTGSHRRPPPGCVTSLQTYGAYGANFNPHTHALISDGVFTREGEFLPLPSLDPAAVMEVFRRLLLERLHRAERLSESFMLNLLSWVHPGFSAFAGPAVDGVAVTSLESQGRYITRPALAIDALEKLDDGTLALHTPPDPRSGATLLVLDPLEWIHRITAHVPDPASHCQRFYGAYSNRGRIACAGKQAGSPGAAAPAPEARDNSDFAREARSSWARLIRKIFETDPLLCPCGARMRIVSFITEPRVIDRILRHRQSQRCKASDPFDPRARPRAHGGTLE